MHGSLGRIYYFAITIMIIVYPFLFFPFGSFHYSTFNKLVYLGSFILILWILFIFQGIRNKQFPNLFSSRVEKLIVLFFLIILLSTLLSESFIISIVGSPREYQGFLTWFCYISLFFFSYQFIPISRQITVIKLVIFVSCIIGICGILQHFGLVFNLTGKSMSYFQKSWVFFDNANHFGTYTVIVFTLSMTLLLMSKNKSSLIYYWIVNGVLFLALLYSGSRGAWVSVCGCGMLLTIFIVWQRRDLLKRWMTICIYLMALFTIVNMTENNFISSRVVSVSNDLETVVEEEKGNNHDAGSGRWGIWEKTFPFVKDYFLIGSGPSTFSTIYYDKYDSEDEIKVDNSHNEYLEIAFSMGVPALIVYISILYTILRQGFTVSLKLKGDDQIYLFGILVTIIGYSIKSFFNISVIPVAPFFWLLLGMCYAFSVRDKGSLKY